MQFSKKATSLVEAMIILTIVSLGLIGLYDFFISSEKLSYNTAQRIKATQISREGIEAVTNIRNTNWLLFSADYENCWNVDAYNIDCIGNTGVDTDIEADSYILNQDTDFRWTLSKITTGETFLQGTYRKDFGIEIGADGFYNQDIAGIDDAQFTREIIISYEDAADNSVGDSNDQIMLVRSLVQWDKDGIHRVELTSKLSNWKNKD